MCVQALRSPVRYTRIHTAARFKCALSAKFVQGQIHVVDSFRIGSHKTKHAVKHLRRIVRGAESGWVEEEVAFHCRKRCARWGGITVDVGSTT